VASDAVDLRGLEETSLRLMFVTTKPVDKGELETDKGRRLVETVGFAMGSEALAS